MVSVVSCEDVDVSESCPEVLDVRFSDVSGALEVIESSVEVADIEVSVNAEVAEVSV